MAQAVTGFYANFAVPTTVFVNSEQALFPGTNAASVTTPNWPYKSQNAVTTSEFLTFDFGASTTLAAIVIDHINVASVVLKGKDTNASWGSPSWTSGTKAVGQDGQDGRYKLYLVPSGTGSPFNYRYLRLEPATSSTTDGSSTWRVGCLLGLKVAYAWAQNFGFGYAPTQQQAIDAGLKPGGGGEPTEIGNRYVELTLPTSRYTNTAMKAFINAMLGQRGKPLVFYLNGGDDSEVYIVHITNVPSGLAQRSPKTLEASQIVLREVV